MKKRKIFKRSPSGSKVVYKPRKPSKAKCSNCSQELHGFRNLINSKMKNLPKTKKTVSRKFGGTLCSKCSRQRIIEVFKK